ncbi:MAG: AAA family ATPase [Chloroflexota bacterium]|nr:AAA family ATPase [Chloroflexota bacterium]
MEFEREGGIESYLQALRAHWLLILIVVVAMVAGAVAAISLRPSTYTASAKILVSPLPSDDNTFLGLQMVRDSGDPTRTVQTAAALIEHRAAAQIAADRLGGEWTAKRVDDATSIEADGQSNLLAVTAKASEPELSARVANEYARAALLVRQQVLRERVSALIEQLQNRQRSLSRGEPGYEDIAQRLNQLEGVRSGEDPTLQLAGPAAVPEASSDPPSWLLVLIAIVGGLGLGSTGALLRETLSDRVRSEQEFRASYPLPVLSRVPLDRAAQSGPPDSASEPVRQAYRSLLAQLLVETSAPRAVMLTSPSRGDGKTSAVVQLALAASTSGMRVVVVDLDLQHATAARLLGVAGDARRLREAITNETAPRSLLARSALIPSASVLAWSGPVESALIAQLQRRLQTVLDRLVENSADLVIIDGPSLAEGGDLLTYNMDVDDVILVVRADHTSRSDLERTRELLEHTRGRPTGAILIGASK